VSSACLCRWRAAHRRQPHPLPIYRPGTPPRPKSPSTKRKSPTSAWEHFTSLIRKPPEHPGLVNNLPGAAEAVGAAVFLEAAVAEAAVAEAAAAEAAAAEAAAGDTNSSRNALPSRGRRTPPSRRFIAALSNGLPWAGAEACARDLGRKKQWDNWNVSAQITSMSQLLRWKWKSSPVRSRFEGWPNCEGLE
jgi:hypothetical protein